MLAISCWLLAISFLAVSALPTVVKLRSLTSLVRLVFFANFPKFLNFIKFSVLRWLAFGNPTLLRLGNSNKFDCSRLNRSVGLLTQNRDVRKVSECSMTANDNEWQRANALNIARCARYSMPFFVIKCHLEILR